MSTRVYCVQYDIAWEDKQANFSKVGDLVRSESVEEGSLIVLPEMFSSGFSMNVESVVDRDPYESERFLSALAAEKKGWVMGGVVRASDSGRGLNQAVVFGPDGIEIERYTKLQPFTLGGESDAYDAGREIKNFVWGGMNVCPFVCYDLRFPEIFRAATASIRPELISVIANWPIARISHWVTLLQARAIENQAYVVGVNRCGTDPHLEYSGRTLIADPSGNILADAGDRECVISADLDITALRLLRQNLPFLNDQRFAPKI